MSTSTKNVCVITNGDSLLGYALAFRALQGMRKNESSEWSGHQLRILCREKEGYGLSHLEKLGAEIHQVNYEDERKVNEALKDVRSIVCIPEMSSNRLKEAENLMKAARHQGVEHFSLLSIVGVDHIEQNANRAEFKNLKEFCQIEDKVKDMFKDKYCIIRVSKFYQFFYYLAPQIENDNQVMMPIKKDKKWVMVNLNDVVEGIYRLYKKEKQQAIRNKRVWNFVGFKSMETEEIVKEIGEGLNRKDLKYRQVSEHDLKQNLDRIRDDKRFRERPDTGEHFRRERDGFWSFPISKFLTNQCVDTIMEYWRLANEGHLDDFDSNDLQEALDEKPTTLKKYFENNREEFKRFK